MGCLDQISTTRQPDDLLERELLNHCVTHRTSFLCAMLNDDEDQELQVLQMPAGWYLGAYSSEEGPLSRDSQYFSSQEEAQEALDNRSWEQRMDP